MKTIKVTMSVILFLITALSIWFLTKIKSLKKQITTTSSNSLTAATPSKDFEKRLKNLEDCFE